MADDKKVKLQLVDLVGIGNLLEHLVVEGAISCGERNNIIKKITKDNDFAEHILPVFIGYQRNEKEMSEQATCKNTDIPQHHKPVKVMFL